MACSTFCARVSRTRRLLTAALLAVLAAALPAVALPYGAQTDPQLRSVVAQAIAQAECFPDKYDSAVWYTLMEPKLRRVVSDREERLQILRSTYCESHRPGVTRLPPGLVLAVMDVESRFNRWAVSSAGAVGLMQVMPFWPEQLGMARRDLVRIESNLRMGCAILRYYLDKEHNDVRRALARYNGSIGRRQYPDLVIVRWTRNWNGADDLGLVVSRDKT